MSDIPTPTPRPIPGFTITPDTLASMDTLHRLVANELIKAGKWHLVESRTVTTDHTPREART